LARQHIHGEPTPPSLINRNITPGMEAVILKALEKDPQKRYPSAAAMLDDVESEEPQPAPRAAASSKAAPRRRRVGLVLASVLALLLLLGGVALASGYVSPSQNGVETALSRINPVDTRAPTAPAPAQETAAEAPDETPAEAAPEENPRPVASTTETPAREDRAAQRRALIEVPNVITYYDYFAADALAASGFDVVYVRDYREGFAARGVTWATEPAPGALAPEGSTVTVYATPQDRPPLY
ncbi:MAG: hypothetical protein AVDCRST_MAG05-3573, partial [uncultured Rubrobacteraceae bacterium]